MNWRLLTCGEHALLVELEDLDAVLALTASVRAAVEAEEAGFADVIDVVPAARTALLAVRDGADLGPLRTALPRLLMAGPATAPTPSSNNQPEPEVIDIAVQYDGPDLEDVASITGLAPHEVVAAHTGTPWRVAFGGFAPGFFYLVGGDPRLNVPRRSEPRTSVPAGSVGLAGEFSAVYPRSSPGGWQLLGHTDVVLFDVDRQPPALLQPGWVIRFVDDQAASR
jgi:KipI family sensor histidine kinase inhibitor